jgi:hypothetical protein
VIDFDYDALFADDALGVAAEFGVAGTVQGCFFAEWSDVLGVSAPGPMFMAPAAAFEDSPLGDSVAIGDDSYIVKTYEPDGAGLARLRLARDL